MPKLRSIVLLMRKSTQPDPLEAALHFLKAGYAIAAKLGRTRCLEDCFQQAKTYVAGGGLEKLTM